MRVSAVGAKRWLSGRVGASFSCPYVLLLPAVGQWCVPKDSDLAQAEPALFGVWAPCVLFDMLEVSEQRGYQEKKCHKCKAFCRLHTSGNPRIYDNYLNIKP